MAITTIVGNPDLNPTVNTGNDFAFQYNPADPIGAQQAQQEMLNRAELDRQVMEDDYARQLQQQFSAQLGTAQPVDTSHFDPNQEIDFTNFAKNNDWANASTFRRQELANKMLEELAAKGADAGYLKEVSDAVRAKSAEWKQPIDAPNRDWTDVGGDIVAGGARAINSLAGLAGDIGRGIGITAATDLKTGSDNTVGAFERSMQSAETANLIKRANELISEGRVKDLSKLVLTNPSLAAYAGLPELLGSKGIGVAAKGVVKGINTGLKVANVAQDLAIGTKAYKALELGKQAAGLGTVMTAAGRGSILNTATANGTPITEEVTRIANQNALAQGALGAFGAAAGSVEAIFAKSPIASLFSRADDVDQLLITATTAPKVAVSTILATAKTAGVEMTQEYAEGFVESLLQSKINQDGTVRDLNQLDYDRANAAGVYGGLLSAGPGGIVGHMEARAKNQEVDAYNSIIQDKKNEAADVQAKAADAAKVTDAINTAAVTADKAMAALNAERAQRVQTQIDGAAEVDRLRTEAALADPLVQAEATQRLIEATTRQAEIAQRRSVLESVKDAQFQTIDAQTQATEDQAAAVRKAELDQSIRNAGMDVAARPGLEWDTNFRRGDLDRLRQFAPTVDFSTSKDPLKTLERAARDNPDIAPQLVRAKKFVLEVLSANRPKVANARRVLAEGIAAGQPFDVEAAIVQAAPDVLWEPEVRMSFLSTLPRDMVTQLAQLDNTRQQQSLPGFAPAIAQDNFTMPQGEVAQEAIPSTPDLFPNSPEFLNKNNPTPLETAAGYLTSQPQRTHARAAVAADAMQHNDSIVNASDAYTKAITDYVTARNAVYGLSADDVSPEANVARQLAVEAFRVRMDAKATLAKAQESFLQEITKSTKLQSLIVQYSDLIEKSKRNDKFSAEETRFTYAEDSAQVAADLVMEQMEQYLGIQRTDLPVVVTGEETNLPGVKFDVTTYMPARDNAAIRRAVQVKNSPASSQARADRLSAVRDSIKALNLGHVTTPEQIKNRRDAQHSKISAAQQMLQDAESRVAEAQISVDGILAGDKSLAAGALRARLAREKQTVTALKTKVGSLTIGLKKIDPVAYHDMRVEQSRAENEAKVSALQAVLTSAQEARDKYVAENYPGEIGNQAGGYIPSMGTSLSEILADGELPQEYLGLRMSPDGWISELRKYLSPTDSRVDVINAIRPFVQDVNVSVIDFDTELRMDTMGAYYPATEEIKVVHNRPSIFFSTLLHELVHAATVSAIRRYSTDTSLTAPKGVREAITTLDAIFNSPRTKKILSEDHAFTYASTDLLEFISETLANKKLRERLNTVYTSDLKTVWGRIVAAISKLLNLPNAKVKVLDQILSDVTQLGAVNGQSSATPLYNKVSQPQRTDATRSKKYASDLKKMDTAISRAKKKLFELQGEPFDYETQKQKIETAYQEAVLKAVQITPEGLAATDSRARAAAGKSLVATDFIAAYDETQQIRGTATMLDDKSGWGISYTDARGQSQATAVATQEEVFQFFRAQNLQPTSRSRGAKQSTHAMRALSVEERGNRFTRPFLKALVTLMGESGAKNTLNAIDWALFNWSSRGYALRQLANRATANGYAGNLQDELQLNLAKWTAYQSQPGTTTQTHKDMEQAYYEMLKKLPPTAQPHFEVYAHAVAARSRHNWLIRDEEVDRNTGLPKDRTSGFEWADPRTGQAVKDASAEEYFKYADSVILQEDRVALDAAVKQLADMGLGVSHIEARNGVISEADLQQRIAEHEAGNYYLPLRDEDNSPNTFKHTKGRYSLAADPVVRMLMDMQARIGRAARMSMVHDLYDFFVENPMPDVVTINTEVEVADGHGNVKWVMDDPFSNRSVRIIMPDGTRARLTFADKGHGARLAKMLTPQNIPQWVSMSNTVKRYFSNMMTTFSPKMWPVQVARDMLIIPFNFEQASRGLFSSTKSLKLAIKTSALIPVNLMRVIRGQIAPNKKSVLAKELLADGGMIQMAHRNDFQAQKDILVTEADYSPTSKQRNLFGKAVKAVHYTESVLHSLDAVSRETYAQVVTTELFGRKIRTEEDMALFKSQFPVEWQKILLGTKDITLNFENYGQSPYLRATIPFFGTAMNATFHALPRSLSTKSGITYMTMLAGASYVAAMAGGAGSGEDPDGKKKFYRNSTLSRTIEIGGVAIPLPQEMFFAHMFGTALAAVQDDQWTFGQAASEMAASFVEGFSPVQITESPNMVDRVLAAGPYGFIMQPMLTGNDAFGRPLANPAPVGIDGKRIESPADWEGAYKNSAEWAKDTTAAVAEGTGGFIDISPGGAETTARILLGGMYMVAKDYGKDTSAVDNLFSRFTPKENPYKMGQEYTALQAKYAQLSRDPAITGDMLNPAPNIKQLFDETKNTNTQIMRQIGVLTKAVTTAKLQGNAANADAYQAQIDALNASIEQNKGAVMKQIYDLEK